MSFATFLAQFAKMAFGYGAGILLMLAGSLIYSQGSSFGGLLAVVGFVLILFGIYSERGL